MLRGSCACGAVRYEIRGDLIGPVTYCHCWRCRKHSGSSFGTTAAVAEKHLRFVAGTNRLASWESSPGIHRFFASCCGSPLYKQDASTPEYLGFRLGTLDDDPKCAVAQHYMVVSKAPWVQIEDSLDRTWGDGPPFGERG